MSVCSDVQVHTRPTPFRYKLFHKCSTWREKTFTKDAIQQINMRGDPLWHPSPCMQKHGVWLCAMLLSENGKMAEFCAHVQPSECCFSLAGHFPTIVPYLIRAAVENVTPQGTTSNADRCYW
mmetsp:Transcript_5755/g.16603  ORF Transcript_5755/g.16603 Transcript_5755/m.16603 type:complete len:122 (+) Transcript_5755:407-772(+)